MQSVDVLIPHFNDSEGFEKSFRTVESQTWQGHVRVVVADDSSDAQELDAVRRILDQSKVQSELVVNSENRGRPFTRNVLLDHMESDFVAWLDAGDEWHPDKTRLQVDVASQARGDRRPDHLWVTCSYDWVQEDRPVRHHKQETDGDLVRPLLEGRTLRAYLWTILAPRGAMSAVGWFDEKLPRLQDLDFFIRFALKGGVMFQPYDRRSLSVYFKQHKGRDPYQIVRCHDYLQRKYAYLYARYGQRFEDRCEYSAVKNAARFARANDDSDFSVRLEQRARTLKKRLIRGF